MPLDFQPLQHGATAASMLSDLSYAQWADYQQRFWPQEQKLIDFATNTNRPRENADLAAQTVDRTFARAPDEWQRRLTGMGVTPTEEQQTEYTRQLGLQKSLTKVGAMNRAASTTVQQQMSAITGAASTQGQGQATGLAGGG